MSSLTRCPGRSSRRGSIAFRPAAEVDSVSSRRKNATGNYIKVVQRVPVKLTFIDQPKSTLRLGPGVSVVPTVSIGTFHFSWLALLGLTVFSMLGGGLILWLGLRPRPFSPPKTESAQK